MARAALTGAGPGVGFAVRLTPRGGHDAVEGVVDGLLRVRVAAPPSGGAANRALVRLLAHELRVPSRDVRLAGGTTTRVKRIAVDGLDAAVVRARWPGLSV